MTVNLASTSFACSLDTFPVFAIERPSPRALAPCAVERLFVSALDLVPLPLGTVFFGFMFDEALLADFDDVAFLAPLAMLSFDALLRVTLFFLEEVEDLEDERWRESLEARAPPASLPWDFDGFFVVVLRAAIDTLHTPGGTCYSYSAR